MRKGLALGLLSACLVCPSAATAATISFDDTYDPTAVPFPATALATLSLFDPALGTLMKVTLTLDADTSAGTPTRGGRSRLWQLHSWFPISASAARAVRGYL